jgi:Uma2 family endonuclease
MSTVTTLPQGRPLTRVDLGSVPDDGHRYELVDGALVVTPAPSRRHQFASSRLQQLLAETCPAELFVLSAPTDVVLTDDTVLQPDLLVCQKSDVLDESKPLRPVLVIEILSPSTRLIDLNLKRARYEAANCPAYWVIDPDELTLTAWELTDGAYAQVAHVTGDESYAAIAPYAVTVTPAQLLA